MFNSEIVTGNRKVMKRAAAIANARMREELANPSSPITTCFLFTALIKNAALWNPFAANWNAQTFGLKLNDIDAMRLGADSLARERMELIVSESITEAMGENKVWVGPMLRDLFSSASVYERFEDDTDDPA